MMKKLTTIAASALAGLIILSGAAQAEYRTQASTNWTQDNSKAKYNVMRTQKEILSVNLKTYVKNDTLPLRRLLNIDRKFRGYQISSVTLHLNPRKTRAKLKLQVNGRTVVKAHAHRNQTVTLRPHRDIIVGHNIKGLKLAVKGRAAIRSIEVELIAPRQVYSHARPTKFQTSIGRDQSVWFSLGNSPLTNVNF
jgi:hypothetical protein